MPTQAELATLLAEIGWTLDGFRDSQLRQPVSLNVLVGASGETELGNLIAAETDLQAALDHFDAPDQLEAIFTAAKLSERERRALYLRYGQGQTLVQVGQVLQVSRERARQIIARALERCQNAALHAKAVGQ